MANKHTTAGFNLTGNHGSNHERAAHQYLALLLLHEKFFTEFSFVLHLSSVWLPFRKQGTRHWTDMDWLLFGEVILELVGAALFVYEKGQSP